MIAPAELAAAVTGRAGEIPIDAVCRPRELRRNSACDRRAVKRYTSDPLLNAIQILPRNAVSGSSPNGGGSLVSPACRGHGWKDDVDTKRDIVGEGMKHCLITLIVCCVAHLPLNAQRRPRGGILRSEVRRCLDWRQEYIFTFDGRQLCPDAQIAFGPMNFNWEWHHMARAAMSGLNCSAR